MFCFVIGYGRKKIIVKSNINDYNIFNKSSFYLIDENYQVKQIIHKDKLMYKRIDNSQDTLFTCSDKKCPFKLNIKFNGFGKIIDIKETNTHTCSKKLTVEEHLDERQLKELAHEVCIKVPFLTPAELLDYISLTTEKLKRLWTKVVYMKKKLNVPTKIEMLIDQPRHYLVLEGSTKDICVFYRPWSFEVLNKSMFIFIDGSWTLKLNYYEQIYIINCSFGGVYITTFRVL